jgi:HD-GYP domain-containing protein (c-di-GMP phosphodiesterase class II)
VSQKVRVASSQLSLGMCVVDLDRPWLETPFLFQGFILSSAADIEAVRKYCQYVYIDPARSQVAPGPKKTTEAPAPAKGGLFGLFQKAAPAPVMHPTERERAPAMQIHARTSALVRSFMDEIQLGRAIDVKALEAGVEETVDSILRNPDAMSWLTQLRQKGAYHEQHAMNTCILAISFGRHLGLPKDELRNLGLCALLHDVGMLKVSDAVLQKAGALTEDELQQIRQHPVHGRDLLMTVKDLYYGAIDVAYSHQEWVNGQGYPRGITGAQISPFTRIVALVDAYDEQLSARPHRPAKTPFETLKGLHEQRGIQFDEGLVKHFIDMIGVFPVGSVVELNTGEIAIVIGNNRQKTLQPRLVKLYDYRRQPCRETVVDLAELDPNKVKIVRILKNGDYGLDHEKLHNRALNAELS